MRTREFDQSLKYDAVPRTTVPIEQFISVVAVTFDTMHATKSHYANCTERVVITLKGLQPAMRRPCRINADN
nr:MAG TPA: hypothetical protein [Caudoviricetes sp.]